jgi:uncharacterized coiled-coil protein SlyX
MTTLTIGSKSFPITSYTKKRDTKRGFYLDLYIPQESIGMDELFNLLNNNEETIVITTSDGTENIFNGFKELAAISCEGGVYNVAQVCTSEYEAQLSLAQSKIAEQDAVITEMNGVITAQDNEIKAHAKVITEQNEIIGQQTELVAVLEETSAMQMSTIESLLLEVIPAVIADTVAEALASNSPSVE